MTDGSVKEGIAEGLGCGSICSTLVGLGLAMARPFRSR